jgi:PAS domain S-box-containing protein
MDNEIRMRSEDYQGENMERLDPSSPKQKKSGKEQRSKDLHFDNSMLNLELQTIKTQDAYYKRGILQNILDSVIEYSIIGTDLEGTIIVWNEGAYRNYGYTAEEMIHKQTILNLHNDEDVKSGSVRAFMKQAYEQGKAEAEFDSIRKNGSHFIAAVTLTLRKNEADKPIGFVMISKNITDAKRIENQLLKTNEELEQFAYIASHDLKAPLRAIERLATWIEEDNIDKLDVKSKENLSLLRRRTLRLSNLIDGILQYSRAGRLDSHVEYVDTKEILLEIIEGLNSENRFEINLPKRCPVFDTCRTPLIQVLSNLINNSMKHHHQSQGKIDIDIDELSAFYLFTIKDDGPGIDPVYFDKIFVVFQTLKSRDELESTGIGLSIVKKIVEAQAGKVMIQSKMGQGTTISFTWPK